MIKKAFLFLVIVSSVEFFRLAVIAEDLIKIIEGTIIAILFLSSFIKVLFFNKDKKFRIESNFKKGILIILISVFISVIPAYLFHGQPIMITLVAQRSMYYYLLFFYLYIFNIDEGYLKKLIIFTGIIYTVVYFSAMINLNILEAATQTKILFERDTTRIDIPGYLYVIIGLFLSIDKINKEKKYYFISFILIFLIVIIIKGTLAVIFPLGLLTFIYLFKNLKKGRILSSSFIFIGVVLSGFFFINILQSLYSLLISAANMQEGNVQIRLDAATFFLNYLFPNSLTYILGNGFSSELVSYGQEILFYKLQYGFYQSDIGLIGDYSKFGILYIIGVFLLIYEILKQKNKEPYILFSFYFIIISIITLSHFGVQSEIPAICILLYLIVSTQSKTSHHNA